MFVWAAIGLLLTSSRTFCSADHLRNLIGDVEVVISDDNSDRFLDNRHLEIILNQFRKEGDIAVRADHQSKNKTRAFSSRSGVFIRLTRSSTGLQKLR
eukprot:m.247966 g.247966  ORF g.247966 m.247966 type:complete len:98 (+) comp40278_c0_seq10:63-356(+)